MDNHVMNIAAYEYPLESDPLKWHKYWLLVDWGLREKKNLISSIVRYKICDYQKCLKKIAEAIQLEPGRYTYIVKLIYLNKFYKMPNFVIGHKKDVENTYLALKTMDLSKFVEIWYCRNLTENHRTVFGRIMISNETLFPPICPNRVELVWGPSARFIDKYPTMEYPFIAIERENWNSTPVISEIIPMGIDDDILIDRSKQIIGRLNLFKRQTMEFGAFVFSCGCRHLCLEFSHNNRQLNFIDWDSDHDDYILQMQRERFLPYEE